MTPIYMRLFGSSGSQDPERTSADRQRTTSRNGEDWWIWALGKPFRAIVTQFSSSGGCRTIGSNLKRSAEEDNVCGSLELSSFSL